MNFLERDLEDIIFETENELLSSRGLEIYGKKIRQKSLLPYGIADLISYRRFDGSLIIQIIELKKDLIGVDALLQAVGYARAIDRYLKARNFNFKYWFDIVLIGYKIDIKSNFCYISSVFPNVKTYTYKIGFDGVTFDSQKNWFNKAEDKYNGWELDLNKTKLDECNDLTEEEIEIQNLYLGL